MPKDGYVRVAMIDGFLLRKNDRHKVQPFSVWDNGQIAAFCVTEQEAREFIEIQPKIAAIPKAKKVATATPPS